MTILLLGASGSLGSEIFKVLEKNYKHKIIAISKKNSEYSIDLTIENNFKYIIKKFKPKIVINCIGLTNLKYCENYFKKAYKLNSLIPYYFCNYFKSKKLNTHFIHISTDHLYFDNLNIQRKETDLVTLRNNYSLTKFIGESFASEYKYALILRTNFISKKNSFIDVLLDQLRKNKKIELYKDYICSSIHVELLANIICKVMNKKIFGVYNLASKDFLSKKDFFLKYLKKINYKINHNNIKYISSYNNLSLRPKNISLNTNKFEKTFKINLPSTIETINTLSNK